ncbi:MAG: glutamate cyclase domain-containing protein [Halieaceae bacterium]|nr:glutamate cyclase domain-containing protein [Halieaceae bacterium]
MNDLSLSQAIEELMVARNLRNMQLARAALPPDYYLRAAGQLRDIHGTVIIGTGFPVTDTFETDGPVGAIALYDALQALGAEPVIACGPPLSDAIAADYRVLPLTARDLASAQEEAAAQLQRLQPTAVISIERPGLAEDGRYYNMRGEDITARCAFFDPFLTLATCPTIAIGDGGNEIGMGNIAAAIATLDIRAAVTGCDELLVADVSNWGAYGLIALLAKWSGRDLLADISPLDILDYLSARGSVDGVTRQNTLTEDGLAASEGIRLIQELRILTGFLSH